VLLSPVWRRAPGRAWRRGGAGPLLLLAVLAATASAASAPLFVQLAGDEALDRVRAAIPPSARTADSDDVRIVTGSAPDDELVRFRAESLRRIPALTTTSTIAFSVAPELRWTDFVRPVVRSAAGDVRARLAAVDDPSAALVTTSSSADRVGVWLPDPVAAELDLVAGDEAELVVLTRDRLHPAPPDAPPDPVATVRVAGTYEVAEDGRRPADPDGTSVWSRRSGGIPTDTEYTSLSSYLVVADVATATRLAEVTGDQLMWTIEASLEPDVGLDVAATSAAGVAELREQVQGPSDEPPGPLRTGLISGIENVVAEAGAVREATRERTGLLAAAGAAAGLLAALVVLVLLAGDRRSELRRTAAIGLGPVRTAGLWAIEMAVPVVLGAAGGVATAWLVLTTLGPPGELTSAAVAAAVRAALLVAGAALVLAAGVAAAASAGATVADSWGGRQRTWWPWVLGAIALTALASTATTRSTSPGPVALLTPTVVAVAVGALTATLALALARRRRPTTAPRSAMAVGRWLGWRRAVAPDGGAPLAVAALTVALTSVLVGVTAVVATTTVITDRAAVRAGAASTVQVPGTWAFVEDPPAAPSNAELDEGVPVPDPAEVPAPAGSTFVWRSLVSVAGDFGYRDLVAIEPAEFGSVASWGAGERLGEIRGSLDVLAQESAAAGTDTASVPVIAVGGTGRVGQELVISGQEWETPVRIVAAVETFPGQGERPMVIAPASSVLPRWGRGDPRLAPSADTLSPRAYAETWLWSAGPVSGPLGFAERAGVPVLDSTVAAAALVTPDLEAAQRGIAYLIAIAACVALTSVVVLVERARRSARRARASDAMLVRVGLGRSGLAAARRWELGLVVLTAALAALLATLVIVPVGAELFDLDRAARPAFEFRITWVAWACAAATAVLAYLAAVAAARRESRTSGADEVVLRDG
jgi:putative ABC transport system permease protein